MSTSKRAKDKRVVTQSSGAPKEVVSSSSSGTDHQTTYISMIECAPQTQQAKFLSNLSMFSDDSNLEDSKVKADQPQSSLLNDVRMELLEQRCDEALHIMQSDISELNTSIKQHQQDTKQLETRQESQADTQALVLPGLSDHIGEVANAVEAIPSAIGWLGHQLDKFEDSIKEIKYSAAALLRRVEIVEVNVADSQVQIDETLAERLARGTRAEAARAQMDERLAERIDKSHMNTSCTVDLRLAELRGAVMSAHSVSNTGRGEMLRSLEEAEAIISSQ